MNQVYPVVFLRDDYLDFKEANLSIASSPILYGLSVYSVMPVFWQAKKQALYCFRLKDHFKRLQDSSSIVGLSDFLKDWHEAKFSQVINSLLIKNHIKQDCLVRILVFADGLMSGTKSLGVSHQVAIFAYPRQDSLSPLTNKILVSSWQRTPDNAIPARAKISGGYVNAVLMKNQALLMGYDDAIALDNNGHVAESTVSNVFIVRDSRIITPGVNQDILEGITADSILTLAADLKLKCQKRAIDRSELYVADEIFLSGSSNSIAPVTMIDHHPVGSGSAGPITCQLSKRYEQLVHGKLTDSHNWLTKVKY